MTHTHTQVADAGAEEVAVAFPSLDHCNERRSSLSRGGRGSGLGVVMGRREVKPTQQTTAAAKIHLIITKGTPVWKCNDWL